MFIIEQPWSSLAWKTQKMKKLVRSQGVGVIRMLVGFTRGAKNPRRKPHVSGVTGAVTNVKDVYTRIGSIVSSSWGKGHAAERMKRDLRQGICQAVTSRLKLRGKWEYLNV